MLLRTDTTTGLRKCPCCGGDMRQSWGLNGTSPNYERVQIWRCNTGYTCDLVGYGLDDATLKSPVMIAHLAELTRRNSFVCRVRETAALSLTIPSPSQYAAVSLHG